MAENDSPSTHHSLLELLATPGNEAAWCEFVEQYRPFLRKRCRAAGLHDHDADEVTGRVLKKLVNAFQHFRCDPSKRFRGYLATVVRNEALRYWDQEKKPYACKGSGDPATHRRLEEIPAPLEAMADEVEESIHQLLAVAQQAMNEVRQRVQENTWLAFWLTTHDERPPVEVARELGLSTATVYVYKGRVLAMLRQRAEELRQEPTGSKGEKT
jgi:RNA polymerase sigma factor (sigma-70 family)